MNKKWLSLTLGIMTATGGFPGCWNGSTAGEAERKVWTWSDLGGCDIHGSPSFCWSIWSADFTPSPNSPMRTRFESRWVQVLSFSARQRDRRRSLIAGGRNGRRAIALSLVTGFPGIFCIRLPPCSSGSRSGGRPLALSRMAPRLLGLTVLSFLAGLSCLAALGIRLCPRYGHPAFRKGRRQVPVSCGRHPGATISPYLLHFYSSGAIEEKWDRGSL